MKKYLVRTVCKRVAPLALFTCIPLASAPVRAQSPAGEARLSAAQPPVYLWYEPEWFPGVEGSYAYWPGPGVMKPTGKWGVAGPGISAEWSQGGESEWNSMGAPAEETAATCGRDIVIPRAGRYRVWVRFVDHRDQTEPFTVQVAQNGKNAISSELGVQPVVPRNDEYMLYWGFSFGWGAAEGQLTEGPAHLNLTINKPGQAWRQVDAILITDDLNYTPVAREKPPFAYYKTFGIQPTGNWRGGGQGIETGASWQRPALGGHDFSMWTGIGVTADWWKKQNLDTLTPYDAFFEFSPPSDIKKEFQTQFAGRRDLPIMSWKNLMPGLYLGESPDLSPESPLRQWLERTKTPFYMLTNYANPTYTDKTGPATYEALAGPLKNQFMGFIHGESFGTAGVSFAPDAKGLSRRQYIDAMGHELLSSQAAAWSKIFKTAVPESFMEKSISCLSVDSISVAHLFHQIGAKTVGYELDSTNAHAPMRIAFERGAARQYGLDWLNYASSNFGDACNYFTQNPIVNRGAGGWFHSKYAVTDGVPIEWYRKFYYLNYLGGTSAIFWEQGLANQWFKPGPGTHPVQLSPFGRATVDFQSFVDRLPDRGQPYTPVAFLLNYGHGFERISYDCKMLNKYNEDINDRELRELFNVAWHPASELESMPITPDTQSLVSGTYGNIFDVLVDRPEVARAVMNYPVLYAAGDVELGGKIAPVIDEYVRKGGTLVVNVEAARGKLPASLLGVRLTGKKRVFQSWIPEGGAPQTATPYEVEVADLSGAKALAWAEPGVPLITRQAVGQGAVILTLVPHMFGLDERAHPALPFVMNGITQQLLPIEVRLPNGQRPTGEVMYQFNRTKDGWLVMLMNNRGVDKTQSGIARVDRRAVSEVVLRLPRNVKSVREWTQPRDLQVQKTGDGNEVRVQVEPGDLQVIGVVTG
jgi:hypothetical protein